VLSYSTLHLCQPIAPPQLVHRLVFIFRLDLLSILRQVKTAPCGFGLWLILQFRVKIDQAAGLFASALESVGQSALETAVASLPVDQVPNVLTLHIVQHFPVAL